MEPEVSLGSKVPFIRAVPELLPQITIVPLPPNPLQYHSPFYACLFQVVPYVEFLGTNLCSHCLGFKVFTAMVMKSFFFWDVTPCRPFKVNRRFGGIFCLHLQGLRIC
jgi:hypothetical protein